MANKQLTATVRLNTTQAEQKLKNISKAIDALNRAVGKQSNAYNQVNAALSKTVSTSNNVKRKTDETTQSTKKWNNALSGVNSKLNTSSNTLGIIGGKLKRLASTYLGVMGMGAIINTSDMITSSENKLNYVSAQQLGSKGTNADGSYSTATLNATQEAMDKMYASSQKVRMGYGDMMSNVSKSMALAGDAFDNNTDKAIRFQEIMAEAYAVGGASAQEMSSSMYQLIQALGAGTLAGDELRSVREGAPLAYKEIEKFAQKTLNSTDSLKDLASQGKITADMVTTAIMQSGEAMDKAFAQTEQTFAQTWEQIKNAAVYAFKPISKMLREELNNAIDSGLLQKVETVFANIAKAILISFTVIKNAIIWMADNWSWLQYVVGTVLIVITFLLIKMAAVAIWTATVTAAKWLWANKILIIIAVTIMLLWYVWQQFTSGVISACEAIVYALVIVALAIMLIGFITGSTALLIIGVILFLVAVIFNFFEQVCGGAMWLGAVLLDIILIVWNFIVFVVNFIIAIISWCLATIYNLFVACINAIIQWFWSAFVDPISGIIEWFVNAFNGGFNGILGAGANAIGQLVNMFLSGLKIITKAFDAVAGTDFTGKISGWQDKVKSWGKNENAVTYSVKAPELPRVSATDYFSTGMSTFGYADLVNPMDAYDTGANWGAGVKDSINSWASKFQNNDTSKNKTSLLDKIGGSLGLDFSSLTDFPSVTDPNMDLSGLTGGLGDIGDQLGGIGGDTSKIADSVELTDEDLEYLRKIAEMEWKKEYTTASIKVDMSNYNTISGENDLDGIVTKLSEKLYEELNIVADGVYA